MDSKTWILNLYTTSTLVPVVIQLGNGRVRVGSQPGIPRLLLLHHHALTVNMTKIRELEFHQLEPRDLRSDLGLDKRSRSTQSRECALL